MDAPVKALNTEKAKALQAALSQIEKQFGKGSIMRLGESNMAQDIQAVSTGSLGLDIALAKILTEKGAAVDTFSITTWDKQKVTSDEHQRYIQHRLQEAIHALDQQKS